MSKKKTNLPAHSPTGGNSNGNRTRAGIPSTTMTPIPGKRQPSTGGGNSGGGKKNE